MIKLNNEHGLLHSLWTIQYTTYNINTSPQAVVNSQSIAFHLVLVQSSNWTLTERPGNPCLVLKLWALEQHPLNYVSSGLSEVAAG